MPVLSISMITLAPLLIVDVLVQDILVLRISLDTASSALNASEILLIALRALMDIDIAPIINKAIQTSETAKFSMALQYWCYIFPGPLCR